MKHSVAFSDDALEDLKSIYLTVLSLDSAEKALYVYNQIIGIADSLVDMPFRGSHPKELADLGHMDYRQVLFKPYRVVYTVYERAVQILLIADGRRDMRTLLMNRMLRSH